MKRRTTIDLDYDLVAEASAVLGTKRISETVHRAMDEVVARRQRAELARMPMPDLTPEAIARMRAPRVLGDETVPKAARGAR
jgi:Arc/MetJ family transcription regulator